MRPLRWAPAAIAAVVLLVPAASAHVTTIITQPALPMAFDKPTTVNGQISIECTTLISDYSGSVSLQLALQKGAPAWVAAKSTPVSFSASDCLAASGSAAKAATMTLTPEANAPGLEQINVTVGSAKSGASTLEGGDDTNLNISISYYGSMKLSTDQAAYTPDHSDTQVFRAIFNVSTNGKSMIVLRASEEPERGTVQGLPASLDVLPPAVDHKTMATVDLALTYFAPETEWDVDNYTINAQLMPYGDASKMSPAVTQRWTFTHIPDVEDPGAATTAKAKSPAPDLGAIFLVGVIALMAVQVRRRDA